MSQVLFPTEVQPSFQEIPTLRENVGNKIALVAEYLYVPAHIASQPLLKIIFTPIRVENKLLEKIKRVALMILIVTTAPITLGLALAGGICETLSLIVKQKPYIHYRGEAPEKKPGNEMKLMSWNTCTLWGGLPIPLGGNRPPPERVDQITHLIKEKDPDILLMQEVAYGPGLDFISRLRSHFSHFFTKIGPNPFRMESGLFLASKFPVLSCGWIPFPNQNGIFRGSFYIETEKAYIFTTHLEFGKTEEAKKKRETQIGLIEKAMKKFQVKKPCYLLGDCNTQKGEAPHLFKHFEGIHSEPTCTNELTKYMLGKDNGDPPFETDDYSLSYGLGSTPPTMTLVNTYDVKKPLEALSDHKAMLAKIIC